MNTIKFVKPLAYVALTCALVSCNEKKKDRVGTDTFDNQNQREATKTGQSTYGDEVTFMKSYIDVVELTSPSGNEKIAVSPDLQGRVMTSTAFGNDGSGYGWINKELFESEEPQEHIHVYGGEERFWLGPEGGQYSIFFKKDDEFILDNWYTPALMDTERFEIKEETEGSISFTKKATLTNYSGYTFDLGIERKVELYSSDRLTQALGLDIPSTVKSVAYQTTNSLTNLGKGDWQKETGLLSIWLLGMYNASPATTIVIPFHAGEEKRLGKPVTDDYFGKVPSERLVVNDSVLYFSGDSKYRSKIGLSPSRSKQIMGSYDAANQVLTIIKFTKPNGVTDYVNSQWKIQDEPYKGDVVNSYNDGPPAEGEKQLGQFYELETSSPALALKAGKSATHTQLTCHFEGNKEVLDKLAKQLLGVSINEISSSMNGATK